MHIGIISFCNRVAHNIKSNDVKTSILSDIDTKYQIKIIQKHHHKMTPDSIKHITATPHLVTYKTNGNPYFLYFTKYEDKEIVYFIDKKIQSNYQLPRIIINRGQFDPTLFTGTLIDGEMVYCNDKSWMFLMCDIYSYKSEYLIKHTLPERMKILYNMLENEYISDSPMDMCSYKIKPYYNLCYDSVSKIKDLDLPFTIRGIYFWAYNLKYKPKLMNLDDNLIQTVSIKTKDNPDFILKEPPLVTKTFTKTDLPDVYKITEDNTYAGIQTIKESHLVRNEFKNTSSNISKQFKCSFDAKLQKWCPKEIVK